MGMNALICECCNGNDFVPEGDLFKCRHCGTAYRYDVEKKEFVIKDVVKIQEADFTIRAGKLEKYNGESPDVVIPDSVSVIGYKCFKDTSIRSVYIPESVMMIENEAFENCTMLNSVTLPSSIKKMGYSVFNGCSNLQTVTYCGTDMGCESINADPDELRPFPNIMGECTSIRKLILSKQAKIIDELFLNSPWKEFSVDEENPYYTVVDGIIYSKDGKKLLRYPIGRQNDSFVIMDTVTSIGESAFENNEYLRSITISASVTEIGEDAFKCCKALNSVSILGVIEIKDGAFVNCESLEAISIPDGSKVDVIIDEGNPSNNRGPFWGCVSLDPYQMTVPVFDVPVFMGCDFPGDSFGSDGFCEYCAQKMKRNPFTFNLRSFWCRTPMQDSFKVCFDFVCRCGARYAYVGNTSKPIPGLGGYTTRYIEKKYI